MMRAVLQTAPIPTRDEQVMSGGHELVAAQAIHFRRPTDQDYVTKIVSDTYGSVATAWKHYHTLGEIHKAVSRTARLAGYGWFRAVKFAADGSIDKEGKNNDAAEIVSGIYCADEETEILTREDGWIAGDQLTTDHTVYGLDHDTGAARWTSVSRISRIHVTDHPMLSMESRHHSSLTTLEHRWPTLRQRREGGRTTTRRRVGRQRVWTTSGEIRHEDQIVMAAPSSDRPVEAKYSDAFVELMAWFWTEGCVEARIGQRARITIVQSNRANPAYVARIRRSLHTTFGVKGWSESSQRDGEMAVFRLGVDASAALLAQAPGKAKVINHDFVDSLTLAQLDLFITVSLMADGDARSRLSQSEPERLAPFELACILAGRATHRSPVRANGQWNLSTLGWSAAAAPRHGRDIVNYTGTVWCPVTETATWLARRHGSVYFTGNSPFGGTRGLIERFYTLMKVPADSVLIRVMEGSQSNGYHFLSASEIKKAEPFDSTPSRKLRWITTPGAGDNKMMMRDVDSPDVLGRVWVPGKEFVDVPDSALISLSTECSLLRDMTDSLRAKIRSRFALAGILYIPSEINKIRIAGQNGKYTEDEILSYLTQAMTTNVANWETSTALTPILLRGPGEHADQLRHITIDRKIFETDIKLRAELIDRILNSLDIQRQATAGESSATRFTVWNSGDDERRYAIQPEMEAMGWALSRLILQPELIRRGMKRSEALQWGVLVDLTELQVRTNKQEDTRLGFDRGLVSGEAVRAAGGVNEKDKMSDDEYVRFIGMKMNDPYLATYGLNVDIDWTQVNPGTKDGPKTVVSPDPTPAPGVGDPGAPE